MSYPQNLDVTVPHAIAYLYSNSNFILIVKLTIVTFLEYLISKEWQLPMIMTQKVITFLQ